MNEGNAVKQIVGPGSGFQTEAFRDADRLLSHALEIGDLHRTLRLGMRNCSHYLAGNLQWILNLKAVTAKMVQT